MSPDFKICHLSDLHLRPTAPVPISSLIGKRALGYANLRFNRGRTHREKWLRRLLEKVAKENADLVLITGDLTSLSLGFEFQNISRIFSDCGLSPSNTMIIPGNHDRYTYLADKTCAFEKGMRTWLPPDFVRQKGYPLSQTIGPIIVAALDTAIWRNPVRAAGVLRNDQLTRLTEILNAKENRAKWPLVALHHAPYHRGLKNGLHYRTGLTGYEKLYPILRGRRATVVHGHLHVAVNRTIDDITVFGVPSASNNTGKSSTQFAYNLYTYSKSGPYGAETVRLWPESTTSHPPVERIPLPIESIKNDSNHSTT